MWTATEMRRRRREAGLCTECGKSPPEDGKTVCAVCRARQDARNRKKQNRKNAAADGRGAHLRKWEYVAWRGANVVIRGTSRELSEYFGISQNAVCQYARSRERRAKDDVFIEREAFTNGKV